MKVVTLTSSLLILLFSQLSTAAGGDPNATGRALENEPLPVHQAFERTEVLIKTEPYGRAASLVLEQKDNPLYPYLQYQLYQRFPKMVDQQDINRFLDQYRLFPKRGKLQRNWLDALASQQRWDDWVVAYQRLPLNVTETRCDLARAYMATGKQDEANQLAAELWTVGKSQPDACDGVFDRWIANGNLTQERAEQRYWLAATAGNMQLARYLHRFMSSDATALAKKYETLRRNPKLVPGADITSFPEKAQAALVKRSFQSLARKSADTTAERWLAYRGRLEANSSLVKGLDAYIGKRLALKTESESADLLKRLDPDYQYGELTEARLRQVLGAESIDWVKLQELIARLPADLRKSDRWQYWYATAAQNLSPDSVQSETIQQIWETLAGNRSFYGFLAAAQQKLPYDLNNEQPQLDEATLAVIEQNPAIVRAKLLLQLDRKTDAQREWNSARASFDATQRQQLAALSSEWGWHHRAIMDAIRQGQWNYLDARFPAEFADVFGQAAEQNEIDTIWATAIARQESAFKTAAVSPVGARGLMQLMPATAKHTAKKYGIDLKNTQALFEPETNIVLGTAYLAEMYERFDRNRAYASAAYNAGPRRVDGWLKERGHLPLDAWIETIPYSETRTYVQNVLAFRVIYAQRAGQEVAMLSPSERLMLAYQFDSNQQEQDAVN